MSYPLYRIPNIADVMWWHIECFCETCGVSLGFRHVQWSSWPKACKKCWADRNWHRVSAMMSADIDEFGRDDLGGEA